MDKAPDLGLPFLYRVVLPGAVVTIWAIPILVPLLSALHIGGLDQTPYLAGLAIIVGFLLSLLDDPIYQILEGRIAWPAWFAAWRIGRWRKFVKGLMTRQDELRRLGRKQEAEYGECWYLLRQFPVDVTGDPTVTRPSRIGNVIAAYEQYPSVRYGMDSVFYWPRIWLLVDKDTREEIDNPWAAVDAILYIALGTLAVATVYLVLAIVMAAGPIVGFAGSPRLAGECASAGLTLVVVFVACIRIAISGLVANGEKFKSLFDLYRSKLALSAATENERKAWAKLFGQLQYGVADEPTRSDV